MSVEIPVPGLSAEKQAIAEDQAEVQPALAATPTSPDSRPKLPTYPGNEYIPSRNKFQDLWYYDRIRGQQTLHTMSQFNRRRLERATLGELVTYPPHEIFAQLLKRKPHCITPTGAEYAFQPKAYLNQEGHVIPAALKYLQAHGFESDLSLLESGMYTARLRRLYAKLINSKYGWSGLTDPAQLANCLNEFIDASQTQTAFIEIVTRELKLNTAKAKQYEEFVAKWFTHWVENNAHKPNAVIPEPIVGEEKEESTVAKESVLEPIINNRSIPEPTADNV